MGSASRISRSMRLRAWPNCIDSLAANGRVSALIPHQLKSLIADPPGSPVALRNSPGRRKLKALDWAGVAVGGV